MPRNHPPRQPQGPTLSREQARIQLESSLKRANELLQEQPLTEQRFEVWRMNAWEVLKAAFGGAKHFLYLASLLMKKFKTVR